MSNSNKIAWFFALLAICAAVFTYLTAEVLSFFLNVPVSTSALFNWIQLFVGAVVLFTCALFLLIIAATIIKLHDWFHVHRMMQKYREIEHERHRQQVPQTSRKRITQAPYMHNAVGRSTLRRTRYP